MKLFCRLWKHWVKCVTYETFWFSLVYELNILGSKVLDLQLTTKYMHFHHRFTLSPFWLCIFFKELLLTILGTLFVKVNFCTSFDCARNVFLLNKTGKFHIKQGQIIGAWNPCFQKTMKFGIEVDTVKIRKRAKFEPCNLKSYQDMDVTN